MSRLFISIGLIVFVIGCRTSGQAGGPWAALGPQRIPPPPTGSIGSADATPPYYQPSNQTPPTPSSNLGRVTLPSERLVANPPPDGALSNSSSSSDLPQPQPNPVISSTPSVESNRSPPLISTRTIPAGETRSGSPLGEAGGAAERWRSPQPMIRRASSRSPGQPVPNSAPSGDSPTTSSSIPNRSVLTGTPIRIVESDSAPTTPAVVIRRPMPVNDATLVVAEPRRLEVGAEPLTEISNLPVVRQSVADASGGIQRLQSSVDAIRRSTDSIRDSQAQWHAVTPTIRRGGE